MWRTPLIRLSSLSPLLRSYLGYQSSSFACQAAASSGACTVNNMRLPSLPLGGLVTASVAAAATSTNLFVSSYAGTISTLQLSPAAIGGYSLETIAVDTAARTSPSWLTKDELNGVVYSTDEGFYGPNGTVSSYSTSESGQLTLTGRTTTVGGPVSSVVYNDGKGLALAHYSGSAVTSWNIRDNGTITPLQALTFKLTAPGTDPARQDAPHPHEVLVDPTDSFIVVPDLGADLVRIFSIDKTTNALTAVTPFSVPAGSGPRHGAFLEAEGGNTYFFLISELANTITSYKVTYGYQSLGFEQVFASGTYGDTATPVGAAAAEAIISPDKQFLLTSSRNDTLFELDNFDPTNSTKIPSDTLQSWAIDHATGKLSFVQLAPAGGNFPRQFSVNKAGTLAAVGLQTDSRVAIVEYDAATGKFGDFVASTSVAGDITTVIWDE